MNQTPPQPPRGTYLAAMTGIGALGAFVASGMAGAMGGDSRTITLAGATVLIATCATLFPGILMLRGGAQTWGMLVLAASVARMLVVLGLGAYFDETRELIRQAYWLGSVVGAAVVLAGETTLAIKILSRLEREREALTSRDPSGQVNA
ncbi:MAG: hypothetical protein HUU18_01015 [Phycisphaerales bacterium]|nr:hypothetical protein [Phycisphaerales bacterium]